MVRPSLGDLWHSVSGWAGDSQQPALSGARLYENGTKEIKTEATMDVAEKTQAVTITKLTQHIGAEATGVDLRDPVDEATRQCLYDAVVDNVVLVIRGSNFPP